MYIYISDSERGEENIWLTMMLSRLKVVKAIRKFRSTPFYTRIFIYLVFQTVSNNQLTIVFPSQTKRKNSEHLKFPSNVRQLSSTYSAILIDLISSNEFDQVRAECYRTLKILEIPLLYF